MNKRRRLSSSSSNSSSTEVEPTDESKEERKTKPRTTQPQPQKIIFGNFPTSEQKYHWLSITYNSFTKSNIQNSISIRLFILNHLDSAFQPDFATRLLNHLVEQELIGEATLVFQQFEENATQAGQDLLKAILTEVTATETAFFNRILSAQFPQDWKEREAKQTWEQNEMRPWIIGKNYAVDYQDTRDVIVTARNAQVNKILRRIQNHCSDTYTFQMLLATIVKNEGVYRTVLNEDVVRQDDYDPATAIVLLDADYQYMGHVYTFTLSYMHRGELLIQSIRSSLFNFIGRQCKPEAAPRKLVQHILEATRQWACSNGLAGATMRVYGPIGQMTMILTHIGGWTRKQDGDYTKKITC